MNTRFLLYGTLLCIWFWPLQPLAQKPLLEAERVIEKLLENMEEEESSSDVIENLYYFLENPLEAFMFWKGGLVFLGGAIVATFLGYLFLRKKSQPIWPWLDALAPGLALGQAIGRLGCVSAGCCYGKPCDLPWAITFSDVNSLAPLHTSLHPTQAYHSLAGLLSFIILLIFKKRITTPGKLMGTFLVLYSTFRFGIEFFRGDYRGDLGILSVTQILAAGIFVLGISILTFRKNKCS